MLLAMCLFYILLAIFFNVIHIPEVALISIEAAIGFLCFYIISKYEGK